jgi:hypothetical protein
VGAIYTGDYIGGAPPAGADDLVIFLRETKSGDYIDTIAEVEAWNNLAAPILMMSPYATEQDKFGWSTNPGTVTAASIGDETEVLLPADPLFAGVTVNGGYADLVVNDFNSQVTSAFSYSGTTVLGDDSGNLVLARIAAGTNWSSTVGTSGTHGSDRIVFFQSSSATGIDEDLTADGMTVLENVIAELLSDPPTGPPTFTSDPINEIDATEDAAYSSSIADNAYDPDSDPMTFSKVSGPTWLSVATDGTLSGTPSTGDIGANVFTVQVDAIDGSDTATLNITVNPYVNQPPSFTSDPINEISADEDVAYSSSIADDASDPESDPMTFSKVSGPTWLSVASNGDLSGTPGTSDVGANVFTVQVDATGGSDTATLNITVLSASGQYDVKDFGAIGDGIVNDTAAINSAIDAANAGGGGTVIFPAGDYAAASIQLKSNVTLNLTADATIVARADGYNDWEYNPYDEGIMSSAYYHWESALIWGANLTNVAIEGTGTINGNNMLKTATHVNGTGDRGVALKLCDGVTIRDVSFVVDDPEVYVGPHYMIIMTGCDNVTVDNIFMQTKRDGINLMDCRDVLIENSDLDSVRGNFEGGDDAIKLGSDYALGYVRDSYNITVRNCNIMAGCNALQFGTETLGPISNVSF